MSFEGIIKNRQSGLRQKYRAQLPKMFETKNNRCPVKVISSYQIATLLSINLQT